MKKSPLNLKKSKDKNNALTNTKPAPWRILVVDDDEEIHSVTHLILSNVIFKERSVELLKSYSAADALNILRANTDIAIVILDVVMETEDAGLKLVKKIRQELKNIMVRIILRTGQPGQAPEKQVIVDYDINDYKAKSELTAQKMFTSVIACLRSYETIVTLEKSRQGLEKILQCSDSLFKVNSMQQFASAVLTQVSAFLDCHPNGIMCFSEETDETAYKGHTCPEVGLKVIAAAGMYNDCADCTLGAACRHKEVASHIVRTMEQRCNQYTNEYTFLFIDSGGPLGTVIFIHGKFDTHSNDHRLLTLFASKIAIGLTNTIHYQKMLLAQSESTTDVLTGLKNRRQILNWNIPPEAVINNDSQSSCAVAMIDIDFFKEINDRYGHDAGDEVLRHLGQLIKKRFRSSDIAARIGGEEFCIVVVNSDIEHVYTIFENFRKSVEKLVIPYNNKSLSVTVSIGLTVKLKDSLQDMISIADKLLYKAKQAGRNRIEGDW